MFNNSKYSYKLSQCSNIQNLLEEAKLIIQQLSENELESLNIKNYNYDVHCAIEELGLDKELIEQLIADYIMQIIKSCDIFLNCLGKLKISHNEEVLLELRELAHKNLGVVKNLRIKSAETLLYNIMTHDDLDYLQANIEGLIVYSILLQPEESFNVLKILEVKKSL